MNPRWYEDFFATDAALDVWQKYVTPEMTCAEAEFLASVFEDRTDGHLLDVPCGNGRHAVELAGRGFRVTGVDISEENVRRARSNAEAEGVQTRFIYADMRELPISMRFDGAFCFGNSFGYLDHDGMRDFVARVAALLRPGGSFCIDTWMAAESILPRLSNRSWFSMDDMYLLAENRYDAGESRLDTTNTMLYSDGRSVVQDSSHWVYTVAEIKRLLASVGLETVATYGSLDKEPFEVKKRRLLLVAEKKVLAMDV